MGYLVEDPNDPGTYQIFNNPDDSEYSNGYLGSGPTQDRPTVLSWGETGSRFFETGVDRGVLYLDGIPGVPWIGLVSVSETPSGGEARAYYIDGIKHVNRSAPEEFNAKIDAYTYPDEFAICDGTREIANGLGITQQPRQKFGLSYRTRVGNDVNGIDHAYKIHIIYNALAAPTDKDYETLNDDTEPSTFSWDISTQPVKFEDAAFGTKYGAHLVLDSRDVYPWAMEAVENVLYGTPLTPARLPTPQELLTLFVDNALLQIIDNGDGTWTATGPDEAITMLENGVFQIDWESAVMIDETTYNISSL